MARNTCREVILEYQRKNKVPDWQMCNILDMTEEQWHKYSRNHSFPLTDFQKICFIDGVQTPLPI